MKRNVREVGSSLAECGEFIDRKNYRLGAVAIRDAHGIQELKFEQ